MAGLDLNEKAFSFRFQRKCCNDFITESIDVHIANLYTQSITSSLLHHESIVIERKQLLDDDTYD